MKGQTKYFPLPGGGRQGDNLYPLIFAIVMQVFNIAIDKHQLKGIDLNIHQEVLSFSSVLECPSRCSGSALVSQSV